MFPLVKFAHSPNDGRRGEVMQDARTAAFEKDDSLLEFRRQTPQIPIPALPIADAAIPTWMRPAYGGLAIKVKYSARELMAPASSVRVIAPVGNELPRHASLIPSDAEGMIASYTGKFAPEMPWDDSTELEPDGANAFDWPGLPCSPRSTYAYPLPDVSPTAASPNLTADTNGGIGISSRSERRGFKAKVRDKMAARRSARAANIEIAGTERRTTAHVHQVELISTNEVLASNPKRLKIRRLASGIGEWITAVGSRAYPIAGWIVLIPCFVGAGFFYYQYQQTANSLSGISSENKKLKAVLASKNATPTPTPTPTNIAAASPAIAAAPNAPASAPAAAAAVQTTYASPPPVPMAMYVPPLPTANGLVLPLPVAQQSISQTNQTVKQARVMPVMAAQQPASAADDWEAGGEDIPAAGKFKYITGDTKPVPSKIKLIEDK